MRASFVEDPQQLLLVPRTYITARLRCIFSAVRGAQLPRSVIESQLPPSTVAMLTTEHWLAIDNAASDESAIVDVAGHKDDLRLFQRRKRFSKFEPEYHACASDQQQREFRLISNSAKDADSE